MTSLHTRQLIQLDAGGDELGRVRLPGDMDTVQHAVQSPTGTFIVSHYNTQLNQWQVSEVNTEGRVLCEFNRCPSLREPEHIAIDSQGNIFVANSGYSHILLLDAQLVLRRVIIDEHQLNDKRPRRLYYNEQSAQLIVGFTDGSVAVFAVL